MQLHLAEAEPLVGVKLTRTLEAVAEQVQNDEPPALRETGGLMMRCFYELAEQYPGIQADEANIDAIRMWMFKNPQDYSVLVAENMFGDIVSDFAPASSAALASRRVRILATNTPSSNRPTAPRRNTPDNTRSIRSQCF